MQQLDNPASMNGAIDVADLLAGIWSRKAMILIIFLLSVGAAFGFVSVSTPKYRATAKVLVDNLETPFTKSQTTDPGQVIRIEERDVLSQVEVANSPDLAREVLLSLDDETQASFTKAKPAGLIDRLMIATGFKPNPVRLAPDQRALNRFANNTSIYAIPRSKVIVLRYASSRPERAALIANRLAEKYVEATRNAQMASTDRAQGWLAGQIESLRRQVVDSEVAVEQFRAEAGLLRGATNTLNSQELSELNSQIILAAAAKAEVRAKASSIRELLAQTGTVDASAEVLNSPLIQRLREQQIRVRRSLAELSTIYLDNHPRIKAVRTELTDLDKQVRAEAFKIVNGLEQQAHIAATREATLRQSLEQLKTRATDSNVDEVRLRSLEREAAANRQLLESFLSRYSDAVSRVKPEAQPGLARIIETATVPSSPYFPKKGPIIVLAGIGGLVLGLGLAFLLEVMAAAGRMLPSAAPAAVAPPQPVSPSSATAVEHHVPAPHSPPAAMPAAVAPAPQPRPDLTAGHTAAQPRQGSMATPVAPSSATPAIQQRSPEAVTTLCQLPLAGDAKSGSALAEAVVSDQESDGAKVVRTIASWVFSQGQTMGISKFALVAFPDCTLEAATITIALARVLAENGSRVIVVDASGAPDNFNHVALLEPNAGLSELLSGQATFSDVIVRDRISAAHILGSGGALPDGQPGSISAVLEALDHAYDLILLHNGPTRFPASRDQSGLTSCEAGLVVAATGNVGEANALCGAFARAGWRAVETIAITRHAATVQDVAQPSQGVAAAL